MSMLTDRSNFIYMSSLPWISFTGLDHTMSLNRNDSVPRVTWGRFEKVGGKTWLPYNIQVNHMFIDGSHVGRFFELLDEEISKTPDL